MDTCIGIGADNRAFGKVLPECPHTPSNTGTAGHREVFLGSPSSKEMRKNLPLTCNVTGNKGGGLLTKSGTAGDDTLPGLPIVQQTVGGGGSLLAAVQQCDWSESQEAHHCHLCLSGVLQVSDY